MNTSTVAAPSEELIEEHLNVLFCLDEAHDVQSGVPYSAVQVMDAVEGSSVCASYVYVLASLGALRQVETKMGEPLFEMNDYELFHAQFAKVRAGNFK